MTEKNNEGREELKRIARIAKVCHQANKAYRESLGDKTQKDWHGSSYEQVKSAINGVMYFMDHPGATPEEMHRNWLKVKEADGWTYAKVKDEQKKTHPCFLPYDELPEEQKIKDSLFIAIVRALDV